MLKNSNICNLSNKKDLEERRNNIRIPLQDNRKDEAAIIKNRKKYKIKRILFIPKLHLSVKHPAGKIKNNTIKNDKYDLIM